MAKRVWLQIQVHLEVEEKFKGVCYQRLCFPSNEQNTDRLKGEVGGFEDSCRTVQGNTRVQDPGRPSEGAQSQFLVVLKSVTSGSLENVNSYSNSVLKIDKVIRAEHMLNTCIYAIAVIR